LTDSCWRTEGCGKTYKIGNETFNITVCQFGATLVSVQYATDGDSTKEMTLNYPPVREPGYFRDETKHIYFGVTNGRVAGRIAKGRFELPDKSVY
jgi:galactose mutarotase-like enzyme